MILCDNFKNPMKTEPEMCYNQGKITESFVLAATGHGNYETHTHSDIMNSVRSLTGCAPAAQDTAAYAPDESERLVLYTSHKKEVWWPIVKEFESRTGIWVEVVQGGTNELLEQLQKEQDAPRADVMFGGGVDRPTRRASSRARYSSSRRRMDRQRRSARAAQGREDRPSS